MFELFSMQTLSEAGDFVYSWLLTNVLVIGNAVQIGVAAVALALARPLAKRLAGWLSPFVAPSGFGKLVDTLVPLLMPLLWLLFSWMAFLTATAMEWPSHVLRIVVSLLAAWVVIRLVSQLVREPLLARGIAWVAWSVAALSILGLLEATVAILQSAALEFGEFRISLYMILTSTFALAVLLWLALYVAGLLETRIRHSRTLSPSVQVLFAKSLKAVLLTIAVLIAVRGVGIDLTTLAVLGGALALGVGFGFQKVVSNLVSGVILLLDRSIKPGDVIAVAGTYGWVTALGGRYVSVVTRDGVEHLIPNETLIAERVENWTHSDNKTRLKARLRVHYESDVKKAIELCVEAAKEVPRVLAEPEPKCLLVALGDSCVELEVRIWISDAQEGVQNVISAVLLNVWGKFREHDIKFPYPQRDLHLRSAEALVSALRERPAA